MFNFFSKDSVKRIGQDEAKKRLDSGEKIVLVDVREENEYVQGHIPGSINIPLSRIEQAEKVLKDKAAKIFVYCLSGGRSSRAGEYLSKVGYSDVTNIGGISTWPYEIERSKGRAAV
ncbi:rhodanese-like domain-containing protein [Eubacteriaceae bacterium ES3]|nr:rhodanese-like domain-containing protein [Eubacteriaceae bacterium ES3]